MFKYMAIDNKICWFIRVFRRVIVGSEANIAGNVIVGLGLIARTEADTNVVPTITYYAQKVASSDSNFDNMFVVQVICRNQLIVAIEVRHLRVFVLVLIIIVSAVENVTTIVTVTQNERYSTC